MFKPTTRTISITDKCDEEDFLDYLHHELTEAATFLLGCTYSKEFPEDLDLFVMNHTQLDNVSSAVRGAYETIKKGMLPLPTIVKIKKKSPESIGSDPS